MGDSQRPQAGAKILAIGDMHLGMRPSGVPEEIAGVSLEELTPEAALATAMELAIEEQVDGVLFAGDLVENMNARYEALRPLELAVRTLKEAGIAAFAVVGNHDADALPALARNIDGLELIGEGGTWESKVLCSKGRDVAEIVGWSFPSTHWKSSPIAEFLRQPPQPLQPDLPQLGLVHGDMDGSGEYAPFKRSELESAGLDAWLLGHVHKPSLGAQELSGGRPFGYLGSLVGLDGGEPGDHGPWLIHLPSGDGTIRCEHQPNSALRWEEVELELDENTEPEDVGDLLIEATQRAAEDLHGRGITPRVLGLRVTLVGASRHHTAILKWAEDRARWKDILRSVGETEVFINKVRVGLHLAVDLPALAQGEDPAGLLARELLLLQEACPERDELVAGARTFLQTEVNKHRWQGVRDLRNRPDPLDEQALIERLTAVGTRALAALLDQRGDSVMESPAPSPVEASP